MSPWSKGVYVAPTQRVPQESWLGKTPDGGTFEPRTAISDAAALARTTPTGQPLKVTRRDGVKAAAALPIAERLDIVTCILHGTMAFGKMAARFVLDKASRAADDARRAVGTALRSKHIPLNVNARGKKKKIGLKGNQTKDLFDLWPVLAGHLGMAGSPADAAMQHMGYLLTVLYRSSYPEDDNPSPWVFS